LLRQLAGTKHGSSVNAAKLKIQPFSPSEEIVKPNPLRAVLCACLVATVSAWAQEPAPQEPAPQQPAPQDTQAAKPSASIPPPKEVPSEVNTGRGYSIEPIYWGARLNTSLREGTQFTSTTTSGDLDIPYSKPRVYGGIVGIPVSKTSMVRISYFQMPTQAGAVFAPQDLTLFETGNALKDDLVLTSTRVSNLKVSFDYLTYFFKRGNTEFRVKTLWEMQRVGITTDVTILSPQTDGSILPTASGHDFNIIYPTLGLGLEHTVSRHFRWEAKGSGMTFGGKRAAIGDGDVSVAFRFGRFEILGGGRFFYFRTSHNYLHFASGTMFGPYAGVRFYFRKERPTAQTTGGATR